MLAVKAVGLYSIARNCLNCLPVLRSKFRKHSHRSRPIPMPRDKDFLRSVLVNGTRFSVMLATPLYLLFAFYMEELIHLATARQSHGNRSGPRRSYYSGVYYDFNPERFEACFHDERSRTAADVAGCGRSDFESPLSVALLYFFRNVVCVRSDRSSRPLSLDGSQFAMAAREANLTGWKLAQIVLLPRGWLVCRC